jgi:hypothetical protein
LREATAASGAKLKEDLASIEGQAKAMVDVRKAVGRLGEQLQAAGEEDGRWSDLGHGD